MKGQITEIKPLFFLGHRTAKCLESSDSQCWKESFGSQGADWLAIDSRLSQTYLKHHSLIVDIEFIYNIYIVNICQ